MELLVAGGGIAGLAAGVAMTRAGHRVVVVERAAELREIGAALSLWPNALSALDQLGLGQAVRDVGLESPTALIRATDGSTIARFDTAAMGRALGGLPVVVLRAQLQAALLGECRRLGVEVRLGEAVASVVPTDGGGVEVTTSRRQDTFDAVIGADGINSTVRGARWGDAPRDCRPIAWRALIDDPGDLVERTWLTVGTGGQVIAAPAPGGRIYWAADAPAGGRALPGLAEAKAALRGHFGTWHAPIPELIEATPPDRLIVTAIADRRPPRHLARGPVVLVGDAAHAMTPDLGQGACQAIEDAAVLAACALAGHGDDPVALFGAFEQVRLSRVRRIVRDSSVIGRLATTKSARASQVRDSITRLVPEGLSNRRLARYASSGALRRQVERAGRTGS